ncbi:MAG: HD domain-containing protein [Planctomycetota bacterium]|nr:HD domain-containing protein [Planctomycetota bacterium]
MRLSPRFDDALVYAADLHREQERKGSGVPYFTHLMIVAATVLEHGADEDTAIAALLHDAVEDQGGEPVLEDIRRRFGDRVASLVDGCSDAAPLPGEEKPPWRERKTAYLAHLPEACDEVRLISAADKLHNIRCVLADYREQGEGLWSRFKGGREGTLWYFRAIADIFRSHGPRHLGEEITKTLDELDRLLAAGE